MNSVHVPYIASSVLQGSRDNMSIVIIAFKGAPVVSEVAKKKEEELNRRLEEKIKGFHDETPLVIHLFLLAYDYLRM